MIENHLHLLQHGRHYHWSTSSILSEFGTLHLEFAYLSDITGNPIYRERVTTIRKLLKRIRPFNGLYPNYLDSLSGTWDRRKFAFMFHSTANL